MAELTPEHSAEKAVNEPAESLAEEADGKNTAEIAENITEESREKAAKAVERPSVLAELYAGSTGAEKAPPSAHKNKSKEEVR